MRYPLFCPSIFNGFFEEFIFHRFLAEQALEFFNLLHGGSKFRGRNNLFSGGHSSKTSFLVLLTPENNWLAATPCCRATRETVIPGSKLC
ncbi:hypothetical protein SF274771_3462 [Shigella flexneri 2747-71]|nr:hypothetical protein SF274771_3917 [Shigella flexneri 2747-71]EGJ84590.1 hypothetical protein SF274771_3462 [Shigella flexneri 2747-71]